MVHGLRASYWRIVPIGCLILLLGILAGRPAWCQPDSMENKVHARAALSNLIRPQEGRSRRVSNTDEKFDGNSDSKTILPGQTLVLADLEGPGVIPHFWNTTASLNPFSGRSLILLRMEDMDGYR